MDSTIASLSAFKSDNTHRRAAEKSTRVARDRRKKRKRGERREEKKKKKKKKKSEKMGKSGRRGNQERKIHFEETLKKYRKGEKAAAKIMIEVAPDRVALDARSEAQQERMRRQAEQRQRQEEKLKKQTQSC